MFSSPIKPLKQLLSYQRYELDDQSAVTYCSFQRHDRLIWLVSLGHPSKVHRA